MTKIHRNGVAPFRFSTPFPGILSTQSGRESKKKVIRDSLFIGSREKSLFLLLQGRYNKKRGRKEGKMIKRKAWICVIAIFGIFMIFANMSGQKIKVKKEDGIKVVYNPLNPVKSRRSSFNMILKEDLVIGTDEENKDYHFEIISDIKADDEGNIYVVDEQAHSIMVFNKDGNCLKTIGRKGQGPGEFIYPTEITIIEDKIVVYSGNRISYFTLEGNFINSKQILMFGRIVVDSKGNILSQWPGPPGKEFFKLFLRKFNSEGKLIHQIAESTEKVPSPNEKRDAFPKTILFTVRKDDAVVWAATDQYELNIVDGNGKVFLKIKKEFNPVELTEEIKQRVIAYRGRTEDQYSFPKNLPPIRYIYADDNNRIFVCTYESQGEDKYLYDVFDEDGRYVEKVAMRGLPMFFKNGYLYCRGEDENNLHQVIRYLIEIE